MGVSARKIEGAAVSEKSGLVVGEGLNCSPLRWLISRLADDTDGEQSNEQVKTCAVAPVEDSEYLYRSYGFHGLG